MQKILYWVVIFSFTVGFSGCSLLKLEGSSDAEEEYYDQYEEDSYTEYDEGAKSTVKHGIGNPAVLDLWQQAETARQSGDYDTAVLQLERALRIEPDDAVMWSRLAELRLKQGNSSQAENLAAKSNAMVVDNPLLNYRNWLIIARARQQKGDEIGAQEAEYTASSFKP